MHAEPPKAIHVEPPAVGNIKNKGKANKKGKGKEKAKAKGKAKASFKRPQRSHKLHLSPMAKKMVKRQKKASKKPPRSLPASSGAPAIESFNARLVARGVPAECLLARLPRGGKSYTIKHPTSLARVQVLHGAKTPSFYITKDRDGLQPSSPTVNWSHFDSVGDAWKFAQALMNW